MTELHRAYPAAAGNSWYPGRFSDPVETNGPSLGNAVTAMEATVAEFGRGRHQPDRTVLIGFSQGAYLLAEYLIRCPRAYRGVVLPTGAPLTVTTHLHDEPDHGVSDDEIDLVRSAIAATPP